MSKRYQNWILYVVILGVIVGKYVPDGIAATNNEIKEQELSLIKGKCSGRENVDRWLLQQTWYYDAEYSQLAGSFDQTSFSFYEISDKPTIKTEGAFCISGNKLVVQYFNTSFVPIGFDFQSLFDWKIKIGREINVTSTDVFMVKELTKERMVLLFRNENKTHVFYRKN